MTWLHLQNNQWMLTYSLKMKIYFGETKHNKIGCFNTQSINLLVPRVELFSAIFFSKWHCPNKSYVYVCETSIVSLYMYMELFCRKVWDFLQTVWHLQLKARVPTHRMGLVPTCSDWLILGVTWVQVSIIMRNYSVSSAFILEKNKKDLLIRKSLKNIKT